MESRTSAYMQMQAHTRLHMHLHRQFPVLKHSTWNEPNAYCSVLFAGRFQQRLSELTFVHGKQRLNKVEHISVLPFAVEMYYR